MSENEERIIINISKALPRMSEFDKGYILGIIDSKVSDKRELENQKTREVLNNVNELEQAVIA